MLVESETRDETANRTGQDWPSRIAVASVFFLNGLLMASWVSRIPAVQARLVAGTGVLGLALLGIAAGALIAMPLTGWLAARWGSRRTAMGGLILLCAALPLPALAPNALALGLALMLLGMGNGTIDVSQNAEAVVVERGWGRPIMSSFHALWSIGGVAGASLGGWLAARGVTPLVHLGATAAFVLAAGIAAVRQMPAPGTAGVRHMPAPGIASAGHAPSPGTVSAGHMPARETWDKDAAAGARPFASPSRALLAIGAVAFCSMLTEGAMADWTGVYLHKNLHTGVGLAAAGYAVFAGAMAAGRIGGDFLTHRLGPVRIVRGGGLLAAAGLALALIGGQTWAALAALAGFALVGLGVAIIVPIAFSAAGNTRGMTPSAAIASVSSTGYFGFLAGPPIIGFIAEGVTLRGALGVVALLCLLMSALAASVSQAAGEPNA